MSGSTVYLEGLSHEDKLKIPVKDFEQGYTSGIYNWPMTMKKPVSFIACGSRHVVMIIEYKAYAMGDNKFKQCGVVGFLLLKKDSKKPFIEKPAPVVSKKDFIMAACNDRATFLVTVAGSLFSCGTSKGGELGNYAD